MYGMGLRPGIVITRPKALSVSSASNVLAQVIFKCNIEQQTC